MPVLVGLNGGGMIAIFPECSLLTLSLVELLGWRGEIILRSGRRAEFSEIEKPSKRYAIIDLPSLMELNGFSDVRDFQTAHRQWLEHGMENGSLMRDDRWSESIAVGTLGFAEKVKNELGFKAAHRDVVEAEGTYALREPAEVYASNFTGESEALRSQNTFFWNERVDEVTT